MSPLKATWSRPALAEISTVVLGQSPPGASYNVEGEGIPFFQGKAEFGALRPTVRKYTTAGTKFAAQGDILLSVRAPVGPTNLAPVACAVGRGLVAIRAHESVDQRYLLWALRATEDSLASKGAGSTFQAVTGAQVRAHRVNVAPTIAEQRRIVEILEDHLSHLDAANHGLSRCIDRQAAWVKGSLQQLICAESHPITTVADVLREPMRNGRSDRASRDPDAVRTLTLTAVTRRDFSDANTKLTSTPRDVAKGLWLSRGDLLVQRSNTPELVGTSALYDGPDDWAIFPDLLIRLRSDEARMGSRFLAAALRSERAHRSLRGKAKGLAGSMPKIDQGALGATSIPLPPRAVQDVIASRFDELEMTASRLREATVVAQRRGNALRRAVLAAAFEGKLTGRHTDTEVIEEMASSSIAERG